MLKMHNLVGLYRGGWFSIFWEYCKYPHITPGGRGLYENQF